MTNTLLDTTASVTPDLLRLRDVLADCGTSEVLWPPGERDALRHLVATDSAARQLMDEARAFDRLLFSAPATGQLAMSALSDRIVARAEKTPRLASARTTVAAATTRRAQWTARWREMSVLAASLVLGISFGANETVGSYVRSLAAEIGVSSEVPLAGLEDLWDGSSLVEGVL